MQTHFVCTGGCNGVSTAEGVCGASDCKDFGKPLKECTCQDGMHAGLITECPNCGKLCQIDGGKCDSEAKTN